MEKLIQGESIKVDIDEQIVFNRLNNDNRAVWSLFLASGYLKVINYYESVRGDSQYELVLTNLEVKLMFQKMISEWFGNEKHNYNDFIKALLSNDIKAMNHYMNRIAVNIFSSFDTGKRPQHI